MNSRKIAIIGAGLSGLTVAYLLGKEGNRVTIFEKEKELGGLVSSFKIGNSKLEKSYHHFFKTDIELLELIKELGLKKKIIWNKSSVGLYFQKKMYPFLTAKDLLKFKPLTLIDKVKMGVVALYLTYDNNWEKYKKVKAYQWMKNKIGKNAYKVVWEPLLKGKFGDSYKEVSMSWLWARINTRGKSKDKKGNEILGYLDGGLENIVIKLKEKILKKGGKIQLNTQIDCLKKIEKEFDLIIDTRPIKKIKYLGAMTIVFSSNQNLSPYYWHNINDLKSPFIALIQHTNLIDKSKYNGKNIYYLGNYLEQKHRHFKESDEKIKNEWLSYLKKIYPNFDKKQINEIKVFKFKNAQQVVGIDYYKNLPSYKISKNRYQLNFAQIYPEDRGMNFSIKEAKKMSRIIKEDK